MHQLITAIESYKEALGQYPPDNVKAPWASSLFYELSGVVVATTPGAEFRTKDGRQISAENVNKYFGVAGIANAATEMREVRSFIKPAASQHRTINRNDDKAVAGTAAAADVEVLVAPVRWPTGPAASVFPAPFSENPTANPWHYLATPNATNNSGSFDLWVEFIDGKQKKMICNWSEDVLVLSP